MKNFVPIPIEIANFTLCAVLFVAILFACSVQTNLPQNVKNYKAYCACAWFCLASAWLAASVSQAPKSNDNMVFVYLFDNISALFFLLASFELYKEGRASKIGLIRMAKSIFKIMEQ